MKRVTIQDIAKEMGLSRNTVAKAFNDGKVSKETRRAVLQKAWEMGYTKLDESMLEELEERGKKKNRGTLLVLMNRIESLFFSKVLTGISDGVKEYGMRMQLHLVEEEELGGEEIVEQLQPDVKGIVFLSVFPIQFVKEIAKAKLPMTFFNTPVNAEEYIALGDVYSLESFYAMNKITTYCIKEKHCKSFAFLGYAEGSRGIQARYLGFLGACNQHQISLNQNYLFTNPFSHKAFDHAIVEAIIHDMEEIPDCIVCENDEIAMQVAMLLLQMDPELAKRTVITGYHGLLQADFFKKDILTVEVKTQEVGKRLVESVAARIDNPNRDISFVTLMTYPQIPVDAVYKMS